MKTPMLKSFSKKPKQEARLADLQKVVGEASAGR